MTVRRLEDIAPSLSEVAGVTVWELKRVEDVELKVVDLEPTTSTPFHSHPHAHSALVVAGAGVLRLEGGDHPLSAEDMFSVDPHEPHAILSSGPGPLRLVCLDCFL